MCLPVGFLYTITWKSTININSLRKDNQSVCSTVTPRFTLIKDTRLLIIFPEIFLVDSDKHLWVVLLCFLISIIHRKIIIDPSTRIFLYNRAKHEGCIQKAIIECDLAPHQFPDLKRNLFVKFCRGQEIKALDRIVCFNVLILYHFII